MKHIVDGFNPLGGKHCVLLEVWGKSVKAMHWLLSDVEIENI